MALHLLLLTLCGVSIFTRAQEMHERCYHHDSNLPICDFSFSYITEIPKNISEDTEVLSFTYNHLWNIPAGAFSHLRKLSNLDLSFNSLDEFHFERADVNGSTPELKKLNLGFNKLRILDPQMFSMLSKLNWLGLQGNNIDFLPPGIFDKLQGLEILLLHYNNLEVIPDGAFDNIPSLMKITLHENKWKCNFAEIYHLFKWLKRNQHKVFSSPLCHNTQCSSSETETQSSCSSCYETQKQVIAIEGLDDIMCEIPTKESSNGIDHKACDVCLCIGTQVNCSSRGLHYVPSSFPSDATSLDLSHNQINCIETSAFIGLDKLLKLDLSWNYLQTVQPTIFEHTNALQNLNLQSNLLTELPARLLTPTPMLISLSISNNSIKSLPEGFFGWLLQFKNLTASKNPWLCDCNMLHFVIWIKRKTDIIVDSNNLLCSNSDETVVTANYMSCISTHNWKQFFGTYDRPPPPMMMSTSDSFSASFIFHNLRLFLGISLLVPLVL
uniref:protein slit-like n=1 Tax=Myxine glutinosa TaxID=7769 RepID=UPI003590153C